MAMIIYGMMIECVITQQSINHQHIIAVHSQNERTHRTIKAKNTHAHTLYVKKHTQCMQSTIKSDPQRTDEPIVKCAMMKGNYPQ
jgi:hypothetical protein